MIVFRTDNTISADGLRIVRDGRDSSTTTNIRKRRLFRSGIRLLERIKKKKQAAPSSDKYASATTHYYYYYYYC